jgi:hypothetical protein
LIYCAGIENQGHTLARLEQHDRARIAPIVPQKLNGCAIVCIVCKVKQDFIRLYDRGHLTREWRLISRDAKIRASVYKKEAVVDDKSRIPGRDGNCQKTLRCFRVSEVLSEDRDRVEDL